MAKCYLMNRNNSLKEIYSYVLSGIATIKQLLPPLARRQER